MFCIGDRIKSFIFFAIEEHYSSAMDNRKAMEMISFGIPLLPAQHVITQF